jgi:predicted ATPase
MRRYIITGAPGAGKTTILTGLRDRGYAVVDEAATDVNVRLQALGRHEPWRDPGFIDLGFITPTAVRRISLAQSVTFERFHQQAYRNHGFELLDVPAGTVEERVELIDGAWAE